MGFTCAQGVLTLLVLTASMLAVGTASRPIAGRPANYSNFGFNHSLWDPRNDHPFHPNNNNTRPPRSSSWVDQTTGAMALTTLTGLSIMCSSMILQARQHFLTVCTCCQIFELHDMRPQQGGAGGYGGSRRRDDEVLCDAADWSLPWLINGELAREEEDAVLQCFRRLLIWKQ
ncbi:hypothetical protein CK203_070018 [Vitis vinifera]|uniref:Uncharacterized protein n=1 Tax=Vitis vinifera TaxID=29760 RepID=A0A438EPV9_VITVI|nr:hypothetical protein CK203_070018 [Vitis vinifera]